MHWRLATALVLWGATLNGCSCEPPAPVLHVSPGNTVEVGQTVTFDSNPQDDADELKGAGVAEVFGPGATTGEIVDFLRGAVAA